MVDIHPIGMTNREPLFLKAAAAEYLRWIDWLSDHPFTTQVRANFVEEIKTAVYAAAEHPDRYPLEGWNDFRRVGPTPIYKFKIVYAVREGRVLIVAVSHPSRRPRHWTRRKLTS
jgi:plasmid stabilization system protein ParE